MTGSGWAINRAIQPMFPWPTKRRLLRNLWYMVALADSLAPGQLRREMLAGEPILIARLKSGEAFALATSARIAPRRFRPGASAKARSSAPITAGALSPTACAR